LRSSEEVTTKIVLMASNAAAAAGGRAKPVNGYNTPAATGIATELLALEIVSCYTNQVIAKCPHKVEPYPSEDRVG
jgi:hypothetical protein